MFLHTFSKCTLIAWYLNTTKASDPTETQVIDHCNNLEPIQKLWILPLLLSQTVPALVRINPVMEYLEFHIKNKKALGIWTNYLKYHFEFTEEPHPRWKSLWKKQEKKWEWARGERKAWARMWEGSGREELCEWAWGISRQQHKTSFGAAVLSPPTLWD